MIIASRLSQCPGSDPALRASRPQELRIFTDSGRTSRPLFIVQDQQLLVRKSHIRRLAERDIHPYGWRNLVQTGAAARSGSDTHTY